MSWFQKKKEGKLLSQEEALASRKWLKEESAKFAASPYWVERMKPEFEKVLKVLENRILNAQCETHEVYRADCAQREAIKNTFSLLEKDLKL